MSQQSMLCTGGGGGPNSMKNMEGEEDGTDSDCKLCLHYLFAYIYKKNLPLIFLVSIQVIIKGKKNLAFGKYKDSSDPINRDVNIIIR